MEILEKVAYMKGLAEGIGLDVKSKEGKLISVMIGILEEIGLEYAGAPGTTAALALLNDQVKKGGVMASSYVGGLSGAFIPVSEDQGMIDAVQAGALTLEKLEAMVDRLLHRSRHFTSMAAWLPDMPPLITAHFPGKRA